MSLYTKLLEIQKLHLEFEKDTTNPFFKSKYVSLDSIVSKLTPHLDKLWILVLHRTENNEVITEIIDTEEISFPIISRFPLVQSPDPQKLWSCITYAKRYNLWQLFNIVTDRDDDGNEASEVVKKVQKTENKWSELHICRNCWEENMAKVFEWKYWHCFKCEHCDKYSKPNPVTSSHWWPDEFWNQ